MSLDLERSKRRRGEWVGRRSEAGAIDAELILMVAFVASALLLTMIFIRNYAGIETPLLAEETAAPALQGAAPPAAGGGVLDDVRRGVASILDRPSIAPPEDSAERAPLPNLVLNRSFLTLSAAIESRDQSIAAQRWVPFSVGTATTRHLLLG